MTVLHQMTSDQPMSGTTTSSTPDVEYREAVRREISQHRVYCTQQITRYRITRVIVIISAASVPVLAAATVVPRWILAIFGAIAVGAEGIQGLYQFHKSALNAMSTANAMERVMNKYMTAVAPYDGPVREVCFRSLLKKLR